MSHTHFDVNGRTVFITGAARGIGKATAERLHAKGANVALVGLEPERLQQNAAALGERAIVIEADVTDLGALQHAVEQTVARFGGIDVGIANAGIAFTGPLMAAPVERVERTLAVNLLGVWRTDRALFDELAKRRGYLLNISSLTAILRPPMIGAYATAKAGVEALSDSLRVESAPSGVAVGCAYFGFLDTDLVKAAYAEPSAEAMTSRTPGFIRNPAPLSEAIDAIERGIERRSARVWAPRWLGPMLVMRGLLQPLTERVGRAGEAELAEAMRIAADGDEAAGQDPLLGVAGKALEQ
ncbi:MAG TPA: short-chain dehydrogenase/reductase [Solirubrobacteraceae bacterium]|jgi:NAD(P)-dependent dehydrogenase (short-subunit alcohol dehydrogenase family)|nr:short-chain dehydrogenase/reductase [Solirubrobacteraceae bacterium]